MWKYEYDEANAEGIGIFKSYLISDSQLFIFDI
jgi:hypothetical protein